MLRPVSPAGSFAPMRSVPSGSFARLSSVRALWAAYLRCRREKRRQPAMARFDVDADTVVMRLHRELAAGGYRPGPFRLRIVLDPKVRLIAAAPIRDRIVHQALVREIGPTFERGFIDTSYAGLPGRGAHRAVLRYLGWTRRFEHRLSLDVRRYFPSIPHERLLALLFHRIADARTRALLVQLVEHGGGVYESALARDVVGIEARGPDEVRRGLPIGSYLSQWAGNVYLDGLDHFVKRVLKIPAYLRYMDDFALFADDAATLVHARDAVAEWLWSERGLRLNEKRWHVSPTSAPSVFLGYRVSPAGLAASRKLRRRMAKRLREAAEKGPAAVGRSVASYRGLLLFGS